ncbi:ADP-L-glycero-D-manno-heptose-6-epimerase [Striga asiatica]|uniref:ADP-L-glycero-D-manno-heptose-6-epimerase n=1 Tax=Striga asiatica TaxID=4170 RepID=A0A5A7Q435_STRAF|nr:ADP-L-glycero-D-manno-heptose-6-epimerase [Striga asiatica]
MGKGRSTSPGIRSWQVKRKRDRNFQSFNEIRQIVWKLGKRKASGEEVSRGRVPAQILKESYKSGVLLSLLIVKRDCPEIFAGSRHPIPKKENLKPIDLWEWDQKFSQTGSSREESERAVDSLGSFWFGRKKELEIQQQRGSQKLRFRYRDIYEAFVRYKRFFGPEQKTDSGEESMAIGFDFDRRKPLELEQMWFARLLTDPSLG